MESEASADALRTMRQSANEFIQVFNQGFHDSAEELEHLHTNIQRRVAAQGAVRVGREGVDCDSTLSDSVGLHLPRDSSSSRLARTIL